MKKPTCNLLFLIVLWIFSLQVSTLHAQTPVSKLAQGTYSNIYDMLQNVPGIEIKQGSGNGKSITIRGTGTLRGSGTPLIVVNGTIYAGDLSNINPQDVESINVLKDAASATAYGAQGANGVIQITLKAGASLNKAAAVSSHTESAYTYFIDHKTPLRVFGMDDNTLVEGVIQRQQDSTLVFIKKRKELLIPINKIKRVEMMPVDN